MELTDTHCHLQFDKLAERIDEVLANAKKAGVTRIVNVGTSLGDSQAAIEIASKHDNVWATTGVHPHDTKTFFEDDSSEKKLLELLKQPKVVAVGEIGLDYYKNYSPKADQVRLLRKQIELSLHTGLPYVFHVREAWDDFWRIFDDYPIKKGLIHSFSAGPDRLEQALNRGLHIALNGIITFTEDQSQIEAAKRVPAGRLILETDAPFLTPASKRGSICEPSFVADTANFLSGLRGEPIEALASYTTGNAVKLFEL